MKSQHGKKEISQESADAHEDDVVDGDSRAKLEQLVKRLQNEVLVRYTFL